MERKERSVVLLSGGIDSLLTLHLARQTSKVVAAIHVFYGQTNGIEMRHAHDIATFYDIEWLPLYIKPDLVGSQLTGGIIPKDRDISEMRRSVPPTYVPARNVIFLSLAASRAEAMDCRWIYFGATKEGGYPDSQPEFVTAMEETLNVGTRAGRLGFPFHIIAPVILMSKHNIVRRAAQEALPLALTLSCYDPTFGRRGGVPCRRCDACIVRAQAFKDAGITDPAPEYAEARGIGASE